MKICNNSFVRCAGSKDGVAFIVVMILTAILMIAGVSITFLTSNASFTARKMHTGARALAIAEAGVADQIVKMTTNSGSGYNYWAGGRTNAGTLDGGSYSVIAAKPAGVNVLITSVGTVGGESRTTILELLGEMSINGAIIAGGNVMLDSSALTVNGSVHANGNVENSQGNPTINGDVSAHGTVSGLTPSGTVTPGAPIFDPLSSVSGELPYPIVPPFTDYSNAASNGGLYYAGDKTWNGQAINPANGIVYVSGNATIAGRSSLRGIIVCGGNLTIDNQFTGQTAFNTNWTVSLIGGFNVTCDNRNNFSGMIFAGNDISMSNNRDIRGKLVALNNISVKNRGVITPQTNGAAGNPQVNIGGWLR